MGFAKGSYAMRPFGRRQHGFLVQAKLNQEAISMACGRVVELFFLYMESHDASNFSAL